MTSDKIPRIAHDEVAFEEFYREHVDGVQRFIARRVHDPCEAADLTAEVFLAAIEGAAGYDPGRGSPAAWMYGVARNVVAAERRRVARERNLQSRIEGRRLLDDDDIERLQERIDAERAARQLTVAVAGLPDKERAVIELVAVDGLSVTDAAAALQIRPVTARVRLHRARTALRRDLAPDPLTTQANPTTVPLEASS